MRGSWTILDDLIIKTHKLTCWKTISFGFLALANGLASRPWCKWRVESTCDSVYTGVACTCDVTWLG